MLTIGQALIADYHCIKKLHGAIRFARKAFLLHFLYFFFGLVYSWGNFSLMESNTDIGISVSWKLWIKTLPEITVLIHVLLHACLLNGSMYLIEYSVFIFLMIMKSNLHYFTWCSELSLSAISMVMPRHNIAVISCVVPHLIWLYCEITFLVPKNVALQPEYFKKWKLGLKSLFLMVKGFLLPMLYVVAIVISFYFHCRWSSL